MDSMFFEAVCFDQNIGSWNTSKVINMKSMFYYADSFNQCINNWDVTNVINMKHMFTNACLFEMENAKWYNENSFIQ